MKKSTTAFILVIVLAFSSFVIFAQFNGRAGSPSGTSVTSSSAGTTTTQESSSASSSSTSTSLTQQNSTSASSSNALDFFRIGLGDNYNALLATPSVTMNYSIKISRLDPTASVANLTLSATSTVPGVALTVNPNELAFVGTQEVVNVGISVASTVNSSTLPVEIIATTANGTASSTFDFTLNRNLIVVTPYAEVVPPTLHVSVGQEVTWLNFIGNQAGDPVVTNVALADGSAASPTMYLNDVWSHTFDKPGTYSYEVTVTGTPPASGVVIVE